MRNIILLFSVMLQVLTTYCQNNPKVFPILKGPYLGQKPPGMTPELFAPGIISTPDAWEAAITFSPDGNELFFTRRADIQGNENRIMYMKLSEGKWTQPKPAPFAKDIIEYETFISPDGRKVFYNSDRPKPTGLNAVGEIWYSEKTPAGWSEGKYLTETINKGWIMFVTASGNNNLYFTAGFNRKFGIYKSEIVNGVYQEPVFLFPGAHPFIAKDESYIIYDAQPDGMGKSQLFIRFKDKDGNWMNSIKLDESINKTFTENIPNISPDGKYFFFCRSNDIYWVSAKIIENFKPKE